MHRSWRIMYSWYIYCACNILTSVCYKYIALRMTQFPKPSRTHRGAVLYRAFYKSRLDFISSQRQIYTFSETEAAGWQLVLYHSVAASRSTRKKKKGRILNSVSFFNPVAPFVGRCSSPTFLSAKAIGNVSLKWHDPRRRHCRGERGILLEEEQPRTRLLSPPEEMGEAHERERTV